MRAGALFLLLGAFSVGIVSAFVVAYFTLDAKPRVVVDRGPTVKILVSKSELAVGEEIVAKSVLFQDVPINAIPEGAITNYMQVYKRRLAYSIPAGCPICDDLLIPKTVDSDTVVKFIPAGSQVVLVEVEQVRLNKEIPSAALAISQVLSSDDLVDIRVVSREESKGELIDLKNSVLKSHTAKEVAEKDEVGELVLANIPVRDVQSAGVTNQGKQYQTVSFLLENDQVSKLHQSAREGRLRIVLHSDPKESENITSTNKVETEPPTPAPPLSQDGSSIIGEPLAFATSAVDDGESSPIVSFVPPKNTLLIKNESDAASSETIVKPGIDDREYSPFNLKTRTVVLEKSEVPNEPTEPRPLPPRKRAQWN